MNPVPGVKVFVIEGNIYLKSLPNNLNLCNTDEIVMLPMLNLKFMMTCCYFGYKRLL